MSSIAPKVHVGSNSTIFHYPCRQQLAYTAGSADAWPYYWCRIVPLGALFAADIAVLDDENDDTDLFGASSSVGKVDAVTPLAIASLASAHRISPH
jgi:hypothetical protein